METRNVNRCATCIWYDQCLAAGTCVPDCDDHTPAEDPDGSDYYRMILNENVSEYRLMMEEYSDGRDS